MVLNIQEVVNSKFIELISKGIQFVCFCSILIMNKQENTPLCILIFTMLRPEIYTEVTLKLAAYKEQAFIDTLLETRGQSPCIAAFQWGPFCELHTDIMWKGLREKADVPFIRALILFMSAPPSRPISLQNSPSLNTVPVELDVSRWVLQRAQMFSSALLLKPVKMKYKDSTHRGAKGNNQKVGEEQDSNLSKLFFFKFLCACVKLLVCEERRIPQEKCRSQKTTLRSLSFQGSMSGPGFELWSSGLASGVFTP